MKSISHLNNFDLIRLFAATITVMGHLTLFNVISHSSGGGSFIDTAWALFPGVPIFFIISGYLITGSWLKRPQIAVYARARLLRILPALLASTVFTSGLLALFGFMPGVSAFVQWFLGQVTTLYVYHTPHQMLGFANGMPNGSVWTLPVEIQFYTLLPVVLLLFVKGKKSVAVALIFGLAVLSLGLNLFHDFGITWKHPDPRHTIFHYFLWFSTGMAACLGGERALVWVRGKFSFWLLLHMAWCIILLASAASDNTRGLLMLATLAPLTLAAAYSHGRLSHRLLRGNDISYGVYLYHSPFIHMALLLGFWGWQATVVVLGLTYSIAFFSWRWLEKPMLQLK